jgi:hypothetical protein
MNVIVSKLTKWHISSIRGNYVRTQTTIFPDGKEREIMIFSGEKALYLGQCTILRKIIIHEGILDNNLLFYYVLSHEFAHSKQWWGEFIIPLILLLPISCFLFISSFTNLFLATIQPNLNNLVTSIEGILISALLFAIPCGFSWIMELNAEFAAIKKVGVLPFMEIKNGPKLLKHDFCSNVIVFMTHPPTKVTIKLWRWFNKDKNG